MRNRTVGMGYVDVGCSHVVYALQGGPSARVLASFHAAFWLPTETMEETFDLVDEVGVRLEELGYDEEARFCRDLLDRLDGRGTVELRDFLIQAFAAGRLRVASPSREVDRFLGILESMRTRHDRDELRRKCVAVAKAVGFVATTLCLGVGFQ